MSSIKSVAVIGAGPSGIAAIKNFKELGFDVTGFELSQGVGGNWRFDDPTGHSSVFETTHIITSRDTSSYYDYPLPEDTPDYPSHRQLLTYFEAYASAFDLYKYIRFETEVIQCLPLPENRWQVAWCNRQTQQEQSAEFDALVVCNGHHYKPRWPEPEKLAGFSGELLHAHDYKRAEPFRNKRVLVIGGGNSACDVAIETSRISAKSVMSWRRGYWVVPKYMFGKTPYKLMKSMRHLPKFLQPKLTELALNFYQGKNAKHGIPSPDHRVFETHPLVSSELHNCVHHGRVRFRPDIQYCQGNRVVFTDGRSEEFDCIVACTGYWIDHPFFEKHVIDFSEGPIKLYRRMFHPDYPHLYFIGLFQPFGCIWPGAELQAKLAARHLAGRWQLPKELNTLLNSQEKYAISQLKTPRHTITVQGKIFEKTLQADLKQSTV